MDVIHAVIVIFLATLPLIFHYIDKQRKKESIKLTNEEWAKSKGIIIKSSVGVIEN